MSIMKEFVYRYAALEKRRGYARAEEHRIYTVARHVYRAALMYGVTTNPYEYGW